MEKLVKKLVKKYSNIFGTNPSINKINVGFTNTLYNIDDKYILKICTDINNENSFKNEISFYENNIDNPYIPKFILGDISKNDIPYFYEILEKVEGVSLYNIWHTLKEEEREDIIKQLCTALKGFHYSKKEPYDWLQYQKDLFNEYYSKTKKLFNEEERLIIENAYEDFNKYLVDNGEFAFLHNDLHFDNIFYNNGKIIIMDFERAIYGPLDFELDILYRMCRKPWKYASEETEKYTKLEDYINIMDYMKKYYNDLFVNPYLLKRFYIYDIIYYLGNLVDYPHVQELKDDIINACKALLGGNNENDNNSR